MPFPNCCVTSLQFNKYDFSWFLFHGPLFYKYLFPGILLDFITYKNKKLLLTLYLLRLPVCSIYRYNSVLQNYTFPENINSHVHITLH